MTPPGLKPIFLLHLYAALEAPLFHVAYAFHVVPLRLPGIETPGYYQASCDAIRKRFARG
jgi:hypothetical protein